MKKKGLASWELSTIYPKNSTRFGLFLLTIFRVFVESHHYMYIGQMSKWSIVLDGRPGTAGVISIRSLRERRRIFFVDSV